MNTGNIADWNGNMMDIGPIYPFVGWEVPMVIIAVIFWIGWHYLQIRMENRQHEAEAQKLRQGRQPAEGDRRGAQPGAHVVPRRRKGGALGGPGAPRTERTGDGRPAPLPRRFHRLA